MKIKVNSTRRIAGIGCAVVVAYGLVFLGVVATIAYAIKWVIN